MGSPLGSQLEVGIPHQNSCLGLGLGFISGPLNLPSSSVKDFGLQGFAETFREKVDFSTDFLSRLLISLCFRALQISYFCASSVMHLNRFKRNFVQSFSSFPREGLLQGNQIGTAVGNKLSGYSLEIQVNF